MKKILYFAALLVVTSICLNSCVSSKKIIYFQGADTIYNTPQPILQQYEMRIKPADQVMIRVNADQPELLTVFSNNIIMGSTNSRTGSSSMNMGSTQSSLGGSYLSFTVDNNGFVHLPVLGDLQISDLTCDEAAQVVKKSIIDHGIVADPDVNVILMNARVTVIGAAKSPKVVPLSSERNTVLDILAQCGDVSEASLRKRVSLYREVHGQRMRYDLDLTSADIFNSPAFYVEQNDMIYIEPNKSMNVRSSAFSTFLSTGASILGVISSIVALVIAVTK